MSLLSENYKNKQNKMVRKRSRTTRNRKQYENDEPETDSDYGDDSDYKPAPKKYSLRQRKRTTFTEDYDYDDIEAGEPPKAPSDDEEFQVDSELSDDEEAPNSEYVAPSTHINSIESEENEIPEDEDELVDFEDMIRADIVVNENRIDYDNVIQKTEIKLQCIDGQLPVAAKTAQPSKPKAKRGRKPKLRDTDMDDHFLAPFIQENESDYHTDKPKRDRKQKKRADGEIDSSLLEPETELQEDEYDDKDDIDYNPDDDLDYADIASCMQTEFSELSTEKESLSTLNTECTKNESTITRTTEANTDVYKTYDHNTQDTKDIDENTIGETATDMTLSDSESITIFRKVSLTLDKTEGNTNASKHSNDVSETALDAIKSSSQFAASQASTIKTVDNDNSSEQANGTITHLKNPDILFTQQQEIDDDDVVVVEDQNCDVIVLDD